MAFPAQHGVQPGSTKGLLIWYQIDKRTFADMLVCRKKNLLMVEAFLFEVIHGCCLG